MSGRPNSEPCCLPRAQGLSYIKVGPEQMIVGMVGLETIFKQLAILGHLPEEISDAEITGMARKSNYIPRSPETEADYGAALREAYARHCDRVSTRS